MNTRKTNRFPNRPSRTFSDRLESRTLLAALVAANDQLDVTLAADAATFPSATVDVLANDSGATRIAGFADGSWGTVTRVAGAGPGGRDLLRYTPGADFKGFDFFQYSVSDASGNELKAEVTVSFSQDLAGFTPWSLSAPSTITATPDEPYVFVNADGTPQVRLNYGGARPVTASVWFRFAAQDGPYTGDTFAGSFDSSATRTDAGLYNLPGGGGWVVGTVAGVNAILGALRYLPAPGFAPSDQVGLDIYTNLRSNLGIVVDTKDARITVSFAAQQGRPIAENDVARAQTGLSATSIDVLANDTAGTGSGPLSLVSVTAAAFSNATVSVDVATSRVLYTPQPGFIGVDSFSYLVRNADGRTAQGLVKVTVMPPLLAVGSAPGAEPRITIYNAETMGVVSDFLAFDASFLGGVNVTLADVDGDGFTDIIASQATGGTGLVRTFNYSGGRLDGLGDLQPFGAAAVSGLQVAAGDLNNDGNAEIVAARATSTATTVKILNPRTGRAASTTSLGTTTGGVRIAIDDKSDRVMAVARTTSGNLNMWTLNTRAVAAPTVTPRVLMTRAAIDALTPANGPLIGQSVAFGDIDGDRRGEAVVSMTFQRGLTRVMSVGSTGTIRTLMDRRNAPSSNVAQIALRSDSSQLLRKGGAIFAASDVVTMVGPTGSNSYGNVRSFTARRRIGNASIALQ